MDRLFALLLQGLCLGNCADSQAALQLLREPLAAVNGLEDVRLSATISVLVVFVFLRCDAFQPPDTTRQGVTTWRSRARQRGCGIRRRKIIKLAEMVFI